MSKKELYCRNLMEKLECQWISKVLSDSLEGSGMNMEPSKISYKEPTTREGWHKLKMNTAIETPVHLDMTAEPMIRQILKETS